jgi:hypothetical protein
MLAVIERVSHRSRWTPLFVALLLTFACIGLASPPQGQAAQEFFCNQNLAPSSGYCDSTTNLTYTLGWVQGNASGGGWACATGVFSSGSADYVCNGPGSTYGPAICFAQWGSQKGHGRLRSDASHNGATHYYSGYAQWGTAYC